MSVTLRVYDSAKRNKKYKNYIDRYSLYVPTPRNKVKEFGYVGMFWAFLSVTKVLQDVVGTNVGKALPL